MECLECGNNEVKILYKDDRGTPLSSKPCLCIICKMSLMEEIIDYLEEELCNLRTEYEKLGKLEKQNNP